MLSSFLMTLLGLERAIHAHPGSDCPCLGCAIEMTQRGPLNREDMRGQILRMLQDEVSVWCDPLSASGLDWTTK